MTYSILGVMARGNQKQGFRLFGTWPIANAMLYIIGLAKGLCLEVMPMLRRINIIVRRVRHNTRLVCTMPHIPYSTHGMVGQDKRRKKSMALKFMGGIELRGVGVDRKGKRIPAEGGRVATSPMYPRFAVSVSLLKKIPTEKDPSEKEYLFQI